MSNREKAPASTGSDDAPAAAVPDPPREPAEVVVFPGLDFKQLARSWQYWKRTGKPYKGAPE